MDRITKYLFAGLVLFFTMLIPVVGVAFIILFAIVCSAVYIILVASRGCRGL